MILTETILIAFVILWVAALPVWPHSERWGFLPSLLVAIFLGAMLYFLKTGRI